MTRIIFWSPNYAPEQLGIPPLVTQAAEWLAARGHSVDVITALPNYPQRIIDREFRGDWKRSDDWRGVSVHRHWLRVRPRERFLDKVLYEATFAVSSLPTFLDLRRRADVVVCVVPTVLSATIATTLSKGIRNVLWIQDVVSAAAASLDRPPGAALQMIARLERRAARRADHVIVCSGGFARLMAAPPERTTTVLNWVDTDEICAQPMSGNGQPTRFLYAGNIGYTQGLEVAIDAARGVDGIELQLVGAGNAAADVRRRSDGVAVVSPPVPRGALPALLASADVQLVLQRRISAGANLPSKIAIYLASGRPILAAIDPTTPAAELLRASGGAVLVPPEDPRELRAAMAALRDDPDRRAELGRRGRQFAEQRLSSKVLLPRLEAAILEA
jgi:colanic acid biosynthesis glycosyl transferase WcaI